MVWEPGQAAGSTPPWRCRDAAERRRLIERAFALGVPRDYGRARHLRMQREPARLVSIGSDKVVRVWDLPSDGR